jgi:hypothetical protein
MQPASSTLVEAQWPDLIAVVSAAIDLEATDRTSGALIQRREIRSAETLLRLALAPGRRVSSILPGHTCVTETRDACSPPRLAFLCAQEYGCATA